MHATTNHRQSKVTSVLKAKAAAVLNKAACIGIAPCVALALTACSDISPQERNLSAVVAYYANDTYLEFKHALLDLNNDALDDAVVVLLGRNWCGLGGCTMLVLHGQGGGLSRGFKKHGNA